MATHAQWKLDALKLEAGKVGLEINLKILKKMAFEVNFMLFNFAFVFLVSIALALVSELVKDYFNCQFKM